MMSSDTSYEIKTRSKTEVTVAVTVAPNAVAKGIEAVYGRYAREVKIPGFRRGRVPRNFLESRFGRDLFLEEAQQELHERFLPLALAELRLRPVTPPELSEAKLEEGAPYAFEATVSVLPEFELPEYRGIEIAVEPPAEITDENVEAAIEDVRREVATVQEKEGDKVRDGEIVRVAEGEREWDAHVESADPVLSSLIDRHVGETVPITFTGSDGETHHSRLTIVSLREIVLPEVDDELAKDVGFENLDSLKADVKRRLEEARDERSSNDARVRLLDRLIESVEMPLPDRLVARLADEELDALKQRLSQPRSPVSYEEYLAKQEWTEDDLRSDYREAIARRIRRDLMLERLAEAEKVVISDDELERLANEEAERTGENPLRFAARLKAEEQWEKYRIDRRNGRVLDLLHESAVLKEART